MELKEITFSPDLDGEAVPETVTVKMTVKEALWLAIVAGEQRGVSPHSGIYNCLTGDVFNRYWDDGVDDAKQTFPVETPPIVYQD